MKKVVIGNATLYCGDSDEVLKEIAGVHSVVTDPPYHLTSIVKRFGKENSAPVQHGTDGAFVRASRGFMGKEWDGGDIAFRPDFWEKVWQAMLPGAHLLAFSGSRTYHRMTVGIEDAGFEIRDQIMWLYGSGFPKSLDISKAIDKSKGAEREKIRIDASEVRNPKTVGGGKDGTEGATRPWIEKALETGYHEKAGNFPVTDEAKQWEGWGTALKPAHEPVCMARKPLIGTNVENVLTHGTGAINIDGCRIGNDMMKRTKSTGTLINQNNSMSGGNNSRQEIDPVQGRFPANVIHDGSDEVLEGFPDTGKSTGGRIGNAGGGNVPNLPTGKFEKGNPGFGDSGSAARFFYCAKASKKDRSDGNIHPTVKPNDLMRYLCRLVTPPNGIVLDPFMGSGSTGVAAIQEGFHFIGIEREEEYFDIAVKRITAAFEEIEEKNNKNRLTNFITVE